MNGFSSLFSGKVLVVIIALIVSSCTTDPDFLGGNLIPDQDKLGLEQDTSFVISAYTKTTDSLFVVSSDNGSPYGAKGVSAATIGYVHNEIFGSTKVSFVTRVSPVSLNHKFGTNPVVDSLVLSLNLKSFYGSKSNPLNVKVYELTDTLKTLKSYDILAPMDGKYIPELLGEKVYMGDSLLSIKLSNSLAQRLITADSATMASNDNFNILFKGLYLTVDDLANKEKSLYNFDISSATKFLTLYYHNDVVPSKDSLSFSYFTGLYEAKFNHIEHDYSKASSELAIKNLNDLQLQDSVFYLQGLGGVYGVLRLDEIQEWIKEMPIVINRAELIIERENSSLLPQDSLLSSVSIYYPVGEGYETIIDATSPYSSTFGGKYSKAKNHFSFNITLHLQRILTADVESNELILTTQYRSTEVGNVILRSGNHRRRIRLALTYTKL